MKQVESEKIEKKQIDLSKELEERQIRVKKKDYIVTLYERGCNILSDGDCERQIFPNKCYVVCSLEEITEHIKHMKQSFWRPEEGLSKKEIKNYPFEKKKWGIYYDIIIEPLSKELEESYLDGSKKGFFETWRGFRDIQEEKKKK
jgi:hypothetical protein